MGSSSSDSSDDWDGFPLNCEPEMSADDLLKVKNRVLLGFLGYFPLTQYEPASKKVLQLQSEQFSVIDKSSLPSPEDLDFEPANVNLIGTAKGFALISKENYDMSVKMLPCYGVLQPKGCELESLMIDTSYDLVIDGRTRSGIWRFLSPSCDPNLRLIQTWRKDTESIFVYFETIKPIAAGEPLSCHHTLIRGKDDMDYYCKCKPIQMSNEETKASKEPPNTTCQVRTCKKFGHKFYDASGLRKHNLTHHNKSTQLFHCDDKACDKKFTLKQNKDRHMAIFHSNSNMEYECPNCQKKFKRKDSLDHHLIKTLGGCKSLTKTQIAKYKNSKPSTSKLRQSDSSSDSEYVVSNESDFFSSDNLPEKEIVKKRTTKRSRKK